MDSPITIKVKDKDSLKDKKRKHVVHDETPNGDNANDIAIDDILDDRKSSSTSKISKKKKSTAVEEHATSPINGIHEEDQELVRDRDLDMETSDVVSVKPKLTKQNGTSQHDIYINLLNGFESLVDANNLSLHEICRYILAPLYTKLNLVQPVSPSIISNFPKTKYGDIDTDWKYYHQLANIKEQLKVINNLLKLSRNEITSELKLKALNVVFDADLSDFADIAYIIISWFRIPFQVNLDFTHKDALNKQ